MDMFYVEIQMVISPYSWTCFKYTSKLGASWVYKFPILNIFFRMLCTLNSRDRIRISGEFLFSNTASNKSRLTTFQSLAPPSQKSFPNVVYPREKKAHLLVSGALALWVQSLRSTSCQVQRHLLHLHGGLSGLTPQALNPAGVSQMLCPAWNMDLNLPVQAQWDDTPDSLYKYIFILRIMWKGLVLPSFEHPGNKLEHKYYSCQEICFPLT